MSSRPKRTVPSIDQKNTNVDYPKIECSKSQINTNNSYVSSIKSLRDIDLIGENEGSAKNQDNAFFKSMWENHVKNLKQVGKGANGTVFVSNIAFKFIEKPTSNVGSDQNPFALSENEEQLTMEQVLENYHQSVEKEVRLQTKAGEHDVAPKVWTHFYTDEGAVIVMQGLEKQLKVHLKEHQNNELTQTQKQRIIFLLNSLSELRIDIDDPNIDNNLMMDKKNQIYVIDFGLGRDIPDADFEKYGPSPMLRYLEFVCDKLLGDKVDSEGHRSGIFSEFISKYEIENHVSIDSKAQGRRKNKLKSLKRSLNMKIKNQLEGIDDLKRRITKIEEEIDSREKKKMEQIGGN